VQVSYGTLTVNDGRLLLLRDDGKKT